MNLDKLLWHVLQNVPTPTRLHMLKLLGFYFANVLIIVIIIIVVKVDGKLDIWSVRIPGWIFIQWHYMSNMTFKITGNSTVISTATSG